MKLVDLTTAKALQELGYDGEYNYYIDEDGTVVNRGYLSAYDWHIPAPRIDDVAYFLRDKYQIYITTSIDERNVWTMSVCWRNIYSCWCCFTQNIDNGYDSALEAAVTKAIEIIKNKKQ